MPARTVSNQGWINYYGRFYKSMLYPLLRRINDHLVAAVDEHQVCGSDVLSALSRVPDPRARRGVRHQMTTIL
ncbi:MAG: transposase family protein, partial [Actinobacteria bacterium]|nr:transposase family protein [Actinomycetota bacterium]